MSLADWQQVMAANLDSAFAVTQRAVKRLQRARCAGAIVNVASIEGFDPATGHAHYSTSKAGMLMLTKAAALEYGSAGIRVNAVSPGLIDRDGLEKDWPEGVASWMSKAPLGAHGHCRGRRRCGPFPAESGRALDQWREPGRGRRNVHRLPVVKSYPVDNPRRGPMAAKHMNAAPGDFAETVLMPGDPLRAKYIADKWLKGARQVTDVRNMWGFTGTYKSACRCRSWRTAWASPLLRSIAPNSSPSTR